MKRTEEKSYYLSIMQTAIEERRELTSFIRDCQARIKELNDLEKMGISEIKTENFIELYNDRQKEPKLSIGQAAKNLSSSFAAMGKEIADKIEKAAPKVPIDEDKKPLPVLKPKTRRGRTGVAPQEKWNSMIYYIMKEAKKPLHIKEVYKLVTEKYQVDVSEKNFQNNILPRAVKANDLIVRTDKGVYFYQA